MKPLFPLKLAVFLAAFLLFQVQLIMGKALLPGFGGSYLVWAACMLFFQSALLLGYAYCHLMSRSVSAKFYGRVQLLLPLAALLFFPLMSVELKPAPQSPFMIELLRLLILTAGAGFLVLSTVSVSAQNLLSASDLPESANPYFLYGTSNLGSFAALLSYPFLIEPLFSLDHQLLLWKLAFVAFAAIWAGSLVFLRRRSPKDPATMKKAKPQPEPGARDFVHWFVMAAGGVVMFLSVTNFITFDLTAIPLLWVLPLSIYLFSFYLNFKPRPWCPGWLKDRWFLTLPVGVFLFMMMNQGFVISPAIAAPIHLAVLFIVCMFCQNELIQNRPRSGRGLSAFYLTIAGGGAAGGALVSLAAPLLTTSLTEYLLGFLLVTSAAALKPRLGKWRRGELVGLLAALPVLGWPLVSSLPETPPPPSLVPSVAGIALAVIYFALQGRVRAAALSLAAVMGATFLIDHLHLDAKLLHQSRNYYGIYRIYDHDGKRWLRHGATLHGSQYLDPERETIPLMYYHHSAPAGQLLSSPRFEFKEVAVVGLGTGSLAMYARPGSRMDFYELDPENLELAREYFTYLELSRGELGFIIGDARLSLERAANARYDLIVMDAFSSDSIPMHLLTVEAIALYRSRLKPGGLLLLHISNRHLDLRPALFANAERLGMAPLYKTNFHDQHPDAELCEWLVMTDDARAADLLAAELDWTRLSHRTTAKTAPWTDRYSNLLSAIRTRD